MYKKAKMLEILMWIIASIILIPLVIFFFWFMTKYMIEEGIPQLIGSYALILFFVHLAIKELKKLIEKIKIKVVEKESDTYGVSELDVIHEQLYEESKIELGWARVKYITKTSIWLICTLAFIIINILTWGFYTKKVMEHPFIYMLIAFIGASILVTWNMINREKYDSVLKTKVIEKFIQKVTPNLKFFGKMPILEGGYDGKREKELGEEYKKTRFNELPVDKIEVNNYIEGLLNDEIRVQMMDLSVYNRRRYGKRGNRKVYYNCYYKGNFIIIDKNIEDYIKVFGNEVKYSEFEEESYNNNSNDYFKITQSKKSDYPNIDEFLADFRKRYKLKFDIIFREKIYIRFHIKNMFKAKVFRNPINKKMLNQYYIITKFIEELVEYL